jgi:hypothetical protein
MNDPVTWASGGTPAFPRRLIVRNYSYARKQFDAARLLKRTVHRAPTQPVIEWLPSPQLFDSFSC